MDKNTLYYALSTIPQVLAATTALLAVFIHFRINQLRDYLVGDGKAVLELWETYTSNERAYEKSDRDKKRLEHGIGRKSYLEIKAILKTLAKVESRLKTSNIQETGAQFVYDTFVNTEDGINKLKKWTIMVICLSFITIIASIISLIGIDYYHCCKCLSIVIMGVNLILLISSIVLSFVLVYFGFRENTKHETDSLRFK